MIPSKEMDVSILLHSSVWIWITPVHLRSFHELFEFQISLKKAKNINSRKPNSNSTQLTQFMYTLHENVFVEKRCNAMLSKLAVVFCVHTTTEGIAEMKVYFSGRIDMFKHAMFQVWCICFERGKAK